MSQPDPLLWGETDCEIEHIVSQLMQTLPIREQVRKAFGDANAAFAAQFMHPDGYAYMQTCDELLEFLQLRLLLDRNEQESLVQILQVACAMHENALNNPALTQTQRMDHYIATASLVPLCKNALDCNITDHDLLFQLYDLTSRAEGAYAKMTDDLGLSKFLEFDFYEILHSSPGNASSESGAAPSPMPASPKPAAAVPPKPPSTPKAKSTSSKATKHDDVTADTRLTPRSAKLKERALAMLNDRSYKPVPLGRRHTEPALHIAAAPYPTRTSAGRTSSKKAHSRGHTLQAVQETAE